MDLVIKEYFDGYRARNEMPPEVRGKVPGKLFADRAVLDKWRNWRLSNLRYEDKNYNAVLIGALDDCLEDEGSYIPLDYKTRGSELKDDPRRYYQTQLDCYCLMLTACGYKSNGLGYLLYYWPREVREDGVVCFTVKPIRIETDIEAAKKIVREAAMLLASRIPKPSGQCEYCGLVAKRTVCEKTIESV
jgi:hypothetical protein